MTEVPPMDPCPYARRGNHRAGIIVPESSDGDITWYCEACGSMRRVPAMGAMVPASVDPLTGDEIAALFPRGETR